jgi:hypothetical protein
MCVVAITPDIRSDAEHMELLERLIAERGIERHGLYLLTSENRLTPDGFEEMSGFVVSHDEQVFFFWTGWDASKGTSAFKTWRKSEPEADWQTSQEYQAARKAAGLD